MDDAIQVIEQREIDFYDDKVTAVVSTDGTIFVPIRPLCDLIGVAGNAQLRRIQRDPVLSETCTTVTVVQGGQRRQMIAVPLSHLNGWLFGISVNRVKDEIKEPLIRYQKECYLILHQAFTTGVAVRPDSDIMQSTDEAAVSFRTLTQMARLAREHYYLTKKVDDHEKRIGVLEAQANNPDAYVSQEQAQLISGAVKAIATVLGKQSGRNEFGAVYGELYSRYGVTSYKSIPNGRYQDVMGWLRDWWQQLTDESNAPF